MRSGHGCGGRTLAVHPDADLGQRFDQIPHGPGLHLRIAVDQVAPSPSASMGGRNRAVVPDWRTFNRCVAVGTAPSVPVTVTRAVHRVDAHADAQSLETPQHRVGVVGEKHAVECGDAAGQRGDDQRPVGELFSRARAGPGRQRVRVRPASPGDWSCGGERRDAGPEAAGHEPPLNRSVTDASTTMMSTPSSPSVECVISTS